MLRYLVTALLLAMTLVISSCVEGEEEIWIEADGSGRVLVHYEIPRIAMTQIGNAEDFVRALEIIDEQEDLIKITKLSFEENRKAVFHLEAEFDDVRDLLTIAERNESTFVAETQSAPKDLDQISGDIRFELIGLTPTYNRVINTAPILNKKVPFLFGKTVSLTPEMLGDSALKYTIHLPSQVKGTNAHTISEDGKTVSWTFLLSEHFDKPMEMMVEAELPLPWWAWVILILVILAIAWLAWKLIKRLKRSSR